MELITVTATDADLSRTTNIRYYLRGKGTEPGDRQLFRIDKATGQVFLMAALDRDEPNGKSEYIFTVEARDEDENYQSGYTNIKVKPLDINDNKPIFDVNRLTGEVLEHSEPGWYNKDEKPPIAVVITNDFDFGINSSVDYEIVQQSNYTNPCGRPDPKLEVVVRAKDGGPEPQTSTATVTIILKDINDNSPVFTQKVYNVTMSEHFKEGIITEVHATDKDENENAELYFSMSRHDAAGPVDYEMLKNPVFELEIIVTDSDKSHKDTAIVRITVEDFNDNASLKTLISPGDPRQTGTATLQVTVSDVNDNFPIFKEDYRPIVQENQDRQVALHFLLSCSGFLMSSVVIELFAIDKDSTMHGPPFGFSLPESCEVEACKYFSLEFNENGDAGDGTATIRTSSVFDREKGKDYKLPVVMWDMRGVDPSSGEITMKKRVKSNYGGTPYQFKVEVYDKVFDKTVVSTVSVVVKDLSEEAVLNSGAVRLGGVTASEFISEPKDPRTGVRTESQYTKFRKLLSEKLGYPSMHNIEIVTLRDGPDYLEVRYAAHGSPYISSAQADNAIILNKEQFEDLGIQIVAIPVDESVTLFNFVILRCVCHDGFDGPRCQQTRHHFSGNSVAIYPTLQQCEKSQTSIEFITDQEDGIIFYNGPLNNIDPLEGGYPTLLIDHGTGMANLTLDGRDDHSNQLLHKLNDGRWHHIDINRNGKYVELVIDRCIDAVDKNHFVGNDKACRVASETPGENIFLNVNTHLHVGGIHTSVKLNHLSGTRIKGFKGCIRNLVHNKKLYDLHFRDMPGLNTGKNGCPPEDIICGTDLSA
ncbi:hypothetical protein Btru_009594 [Bulinus truncatus]|nr:hypothetical protein Btru_009594 [Bulinus truncatus]